MARKLTDIEIKQIEYLRNRRQRVIEAMVDACEEINDQINEVKSGQWIKEMRNGCKK